MICMYQLNISDRNSRSLDSRADRQTGRTKENLTWFFILSRCLIIGLIIIELNVSEGNACLYKDYTILGLIKIRKRPLWLHCCTHKYRSCCHVVMLYFALQSILPPSNLLTFLLRSQTSPRLWGVWQQDRPTATEGPGCLELKTDMACFAVSPPPPVEQRDTALGSENVPPIRLIQLKLAGR